jgi:hypothetical protein
MALTAVAVLICLASEPALAFDRLGIAWTPLRLALLAAAVVSGYGLHVHGRWAFASMATACVATAALGRDVGEMRRNLNDLADWLRVTITNLIPTTPLQWGVTAVVASFVLLGVGASISLREDPRNVT